jgi:hypothetical protein
MELDTGTRGMLDKIIDNAVVNIKNVARVFFNPESKKQLFIQNESDFVLGLALGWILQSFSTVFLFTHGRNPNEQEISETGRVLSTRLAEVRESIFKAG